MKQKNMIMLGVAVGCGLIAAVAVAKLSAGSAKAAPTKQVLVAKADLPLLTRFDDTNLSTTVGWMEVPLEMVPEEAIKDPNELKGKELSRTLRKGNPISITDLASGSGIVIPSGFKQVSIKIPRENAVTGFARPGSKVDVVYHEKATIGKGKVGTVFRDMLVLAVNEMDRNPEKSGPAILQVDTVSLAVNDKQAKLITVLESRQGSVLKLVLRQNEMKEEERKAHEKEEAAWMAAYIDDEIDEKKPEVKTVEVKPEVSAEKLETVVLAIEEVPMNTFLNKDTIKKYFDKIEVKTAPPGAVKNLDHLLGKVLVKDLKKGQNLFEDSVGDQFVEVVKPKEDPKIEPMEVKNPPVKDPVETKVEPKPEHKPLARFEQVIQQGGVTRRVVWLEVKPGEWKSFDNDRDADSFKSSDTKKDESKPVGGM